jgi:hypothetical protein
MARFLFLISQVGADQNHMVYERFLGVRVAFSATGEGRLEPEALSNLFHNKLPVARLFILD